MEVLSGLGAGVEGARGWGRAGGASGEGTVSMDHRKTVAFVPENGGLEGSEQRRETT